MNSAFGTAKTAAIIHWIRDTAIVKKLQTLSNSCWNFHQCTVKGNSMKDGEQKISQYFFLQLL